MTMEQVATALLVWIASHSSYREAAALPPPPIVTMTAEQLTAVVRQRSGAAARDADGWRIYGYFSLDDEDRGTIYIVRPADTPGAELFEDHADNPIFRERLLHELVHYAQHATGAVQQLQCPQMRELAAYYLGGLYLKQRNVADPLPDRMFLAIWTSKC